MEIATNILLHVFLIASLANAAYVVFVITVSLCSEKHLNLDSVRFTTGVIIPTALVALLLRHREMIVDEMHQVVIVDVCLFVVIMHYLFMAIPTKLAKFIGHLFLFPNFLIAVWAYTSN